MRDIVGILSIIVYWFLLSLMLTFISQDTSLLSLSDTIGNTSIDYTLDSSTLNVTDTADTTTGSVSYVNMLVRILTFRIPKTEGSPILFIRLVEMFNFILVILLGILMYRQIRSGGG